MRSVAERVLALQALLSDQNLDAYVVPSADPHQSEYVADVWK
jgi:Xaa-Pro aminopeptidase